jgi:hypothetical protein
VAVCEKVSLVQLRVRRARRNSQWRPYNDESEALINSPSASLVHTCKHTHTHQHTGRSLSQRTNSQNDESWLPQTGPQRCYYASRTLLGAWERFQTSFPEMDVPKWVGALANVYGSRRWCYYEYAREQFNVDARRRLHEAKSTSGVNYTTFHLICDLEINS